MTPEAFEAACLSLPAATLSVQWVDAHVFKVGGKMFALARYDDASAPPRFSFKASDMAFELLIEQGLGTPAPYLQRARWVLLTSPDALPDDELRAYLAQAHALIAARLTRAARRSLGLA
jgi:predicted DNA-binding protein (MmcQ/YjbR family)